MEFADTAIQGLVLFTPTPHHDERGFFSRTFDADTAGRPGWTPTPSCRTACRARPTAWYAGSTCGSGGARASWSAAPTVRSSTSSSTSDPRRAATERWLSFELDGDTQRSIFIPPGCAHGFQTLSVELRRVLPDRSAARPFRGPDDRPRRPGARASRGRSPRAVMSEADRSASPLAGPRRSSCGGCRWSDSRVVPSRHHHPSVNGARSTWQRAYNPELKPTVSEEMREPSNRGREHVPHCDSEPWLLPDASRAPSTTCATSTPRGASMRRSLRRMERATPEEITAYQERRLRLLVRLAAARSPYYRRGSPGAASVRQRSGHWRTSSACPCSSAAPGQRRRAVLRLPASPDVGHDSSGTSGSVVTVYRTAGSSAYELSALERQWGWFGLPPRSRRILLRRDDPDPKEDRRLVPRGPGRMADGGVQLPVGCGRPRPAALRDARLPPGAIEGWPSSIAILASRLSERGEYFPVRAVITSSEVMTTQQMKLLREVFKAPVVDHYGQSERVAMAGVCEAGGYHAFPDYGIMELLPVAGQADRFEIVGTPLHNWGFPLVPLPHWGPGHRGPRRARVRVAGPFPCSARSTGASRTTSRPPTAVRFPRPAGSRTT